MREILPKSTIIGVLVNPTDPITSTGEMNEMRGAARSVGQQIEILQASTERDIDAAFADESGQSVLSKSAVSQVTEVLWQQYEAFAGRDLSEFRCCTCLSTA